ncbi:MAG TPA: DUF420 domain-containing protein [Pyrinomonadaceae bacterium]|jgi:uncharacterized membrane protein YozB (DUF420 family)|nr:DUF420 domain-containing protein [Pyrinomonadaceae bacterium]
MNDSALPHLNAALNSLSFLLLVAGFYLIRRGRVAAHRSCMVGALVVSLLFLVSYVVYHYNYGSVKFTGQGAVRLVYFVILVTHVVLAAVIAPLIIITLGLARRGDYARHRRWARWTYPLWVYVSVTGVVVYLMLYRLYARG